MGSEMCIRDRCTCTVGLSPDAVLGGDGVVVRGRGARGRPGLPADSHASRGAGAVVPRLLVQACEVATCCWRCVPWRGEVWRDGARRESFLFQGEQCLNQSVCVCARAARPASRCGLDEKRVLRSSYGGNAASLRAPALLLLELLWLVAVTLHAGARAAGPTRLRVTATACMHTTGFRI